MTLAGSRRPSFGILPTCAVFAGTSVATGWNVFVQRLPLPAFDIAIAVTYFECRRCCLQHCYMQWHSWWHLHTQRWLQEQKREPDRCLAFALSRDHVSKDTELCRSCFVLCKHFCAIDLKRMVHAKKAQAADRTPTFVRAALCFMGHLVCADSILIVELRNKVRLPLL